MDAGHKDGRQIVTNPQRVSRRSIRSGSEVRHGRIYQDSTEPSVRTVTPEPIQSAAFGIAEHGVLQTSPPPSRLYQSQDAVHSAEASASVSNTDEEGTADVRSRIGHKKHKARGDTSVEASPKSFINKTRRRLGSITTGAQLAGHQADSSSTIGHQPISGSVTFPNLGDVRTQLPRTPRRTISSDTASSILRSPPLTNTDSNKILQLMRTTCGRMHGILFFRTLGTSAWESGYCAINVSSGSLVCQNQGEPSSAKTLLPDLRGCSVRTNYDAELQSTFISVVLPSTSFSCQLRPPVPETFDSWLAALLCWQPLQPKGIHNKMVKIQSAAATQKRPIGSRRVSDMSGHRSTATVKVGRMLLWDGPIPAGSQRHLSKRNADFDTLSKGSSWKCVSCTLHENGTFKLLTGIDAQTICSVRLSHLARCAVQRLDMSVLDAPYCLVIYPQYAANPTNSRAANPLVLGLESQNAYEAWFVLLRALTAPELYGPENHDQALSVNSAGSDQYDEHANTFRIERSLTIKITEAKLQREPISDSSQSQHGTKARHAQRSLNEVEVYAEVVFGRDLRARTMQKACTHSAFWLEEFLLSDLPPVLSNVSVSVRVGNPAEQEWIMIAPDSCELATPDLSQVSGLSGAEVTSNDPDLGRVNIQIDELEQEKVIEKWWQLVDKHGRVTGSIFMKLTLSETVVLMESEYTQMSVLLHKFDNGLTTQIAHHLNRELKQLSEVLLDIFQASETASEWINTLIEEEIDGIYKETPPMRMRFSARIHSNDSYESAEHRELLVRDLSRSATMEANLLFRGNSLVTKALDAHMRRLGRQYLEDTLGEQLRTILRRNPDCEVDPAKIKSQDHMDRNWATLMTLTSDVWRAISISAPRCPPGMRVMFKHIRSCAEDRYGSFIRTVKYTSVSGFLFLRFFCPAILNPKLFGLIESKYITCSLGVPVLTLVRQPSRSSPSYLYTNCKISECPSEHGQVWHKRDMDGTHE